MKGAKSEGEIFFDVKWALFNAKTQKVMLELPGEGSFQTGSDLLTGDEIIQKGVVQVTRNLIADPAFIAALSAPVDTAPASSAAAAAYVFPPLPAPKEGAAKNGTMLAAAVVTLETDGSSGSGFYISRDGYLLTNRHVVGEAKFVKVRTATGRELPGEVMGEFHRTWRL